MTDRQVVIDGQFVSERVHRIVAAIQEYSPELMVQWIPPGARNDEQAAFKIVHYPLGEKPYVVFHVKNEDEFDERILARIIAGDQRNGRVTYSDIEASEKARQLLDKQKFLDAIEEANDIAHHVFRSHKTTYKVSKDLTIKDYGDNVRPYRRP